MGRKPSIYELLLFIFGCSLCLYVFVGVIAMMLIPTNPDNVEIRKQLVAIIHIILGSVMAILSAKLINKK